MTSPSQVKLEFLIIFFKTNHSSCYSSYGSLKSLNGICAYELTKMENQKGAVKMRDLDIRIREDEVYNGS
jgi:hypothetical protein